MCNERIKNVLLMRRKMTTLDILGFSTSGYMHLVNVFTIMNKLAYFLLGSDCKQC